MLLAADAGLRTEPGVNLTRARFSAFRTETVFAEHRGRALRAERDRVRRRHRGRGRRGRRQPDPLLPRLARRPRGRRRATSTSWSSSCPGHAPRVAAEAVALLRAPACPARPHDADPRRRAARPPGARVGRPRGGARPRARARGLVRRHELRAARTGSARSGFGSEQVNVTADATTPGRPRQLPLGRRGRGGPRRCRSCATGCSPASSPRARRPSEIGLERSGGCMRAEGFSRQPIVRMTNVNLEPGRRRDARRPDRRHRRRPPDRDEPLLVDRQPPAPLPVRGRGGVGDQGRRARAAAAQPELRGRDARVLGELRRGLLAGRVAS